jgi:hypothetical protein
VQDYYPSEVRSVSTAMGNVKMSCRLLPSEQHWPKVWSSLVAFYKFKFCRWEDGLRVNRRVIGSLVIKYLYSHRCGWTCSNECSVTSPLAIEIASYCIFQTPQLQISCVPSSSSLNISILSLHYPCIPRFKDFSARPQVD